MSYTDVIITFDKEHQDCDDLAQAWLDILYVQAELDRTMWERKEAA